MMSNCWSFETLLEQYLSFKRPNTSRALRSDLNDLLRFLRVSAPGASDLELILQASDVEIDDYFGYLRTKRKLANATLKRKFSILQPFFRFVYRRYRRQNENPFDLSEFEERRKALPRKIVREVKIPAFNKAAELVTTPSAYTKKGIRDRAILAALFGGGLRRTEAINLRLDSLQKTDRKTWYLRLEETKGGGNNVQALPRWAAAALCRLALQRVNEGAQPSDQLFVRYRTRRELPLEGAIPQKTFYRMFKAWANEAGCPELVPHSARATPITKLLCDGLSHRDVQRFSRHASVTTVEIYDKSRLAIDDSPATKLRYA